MYILQRYISICRNHVPETAVYHFVIRLSHMDDRMGYDCFDIWIDNIK